MSDDRESRPAPILASDAEREHSIRQLREAAGDRSQLRTASSARAWTAARRLLRPVKSTRGCRAAQGVRLPVLPERHLAVSATVFGHANFSADSRAARTSDIQALNDAEAESARG